MMDNSTLDNQTMDNQTKERVEALEELGTLADLPAEYVKGINDKNLVPLWPSLRDVLPPLAPKPRTKPTMWAYQDIRDPLLQAGELTPVEKAERRVLVLANPGLGLENMAASPVIYLGMQLLLPGEWAPSHRHTPNAVRLIVEGEGAYTTIDGIKCPMEHGDLILTPSGTWHEHGHDGDKPVIWLDILDLPLVYYSEATYVEPIGRQEVKTTAIHSPYVNGIVPIKNFVRHDVPYPVLRYRWQDVKHALHTIAENEPDTKIVQVAYTNPENGKPAENIIGYSCIMLRPNETVELAKRSCAMAFHIIDGNIKMHVKNVDEVLDFTMTRSDTSVTPCFAEINLTNLNNEPSYVFVADEAPFQQKIGVYSERERG